MSDTRETGTRVGVRLYTLRGLWLARGRNSASLYASFSQRHTVRFFDVFCARLELLYDYHLN